MNQAIGLVALVVRDYDEALEFYVGKLGFTLVEDTAIAEQNKRWVVVALPGSSGAHLLLAQAVGEAQMSRVGNQTGGRVSLFLYTDDFGRDFRAFQAKGIEFVREPATESYGTVAVFRTCTVICGICCSSAASNARRRCGDSKRSRIPSAAGLAAS